MQKNILALQFNAALGDKAANFEKVEAMLEGALAKNVPSDIFPTAERPDILFLPEVWQTGWYCDDFLKGAEDEIGEGAPTVEFLKNLARKHNINIVGGSYIRKTPQGLKNSTPIINRKGELLAHYDKNHLFVPDGEGCLVAGEKLLCVELEGLKIGLSICYDVRFPELFRAFGKDKMPHLLVNLSAWPKTRTRHYTTLCTARAIENQAYFLGLSQTGEIKEGGGVYNSGNSLLVDPFGDTIEQLGEEECYIFKTVDTQKVAQIREKFPNLAAIRNGGYKVEYI